MKQLKEKIHFIDLYLNSSILNIERNQYKEKHWDTFLRVAKSEQVQLLIYMKKTDGLALVRVPDIYNAISRITGMNETTFCFNCLQVKGMSKFIASVGMSKFPLMQLFISSLKLCFLLFRLVTICIIKSIMATFLVYKMNNWLFGFNLALGVQSL